MMMMPMDYIYIYIYFGGVFGDGGCVCQMLYMPTGWRHYAVPAPEPDGAAAAAGAEGSTPSAATVKYAAETKKAYDTAVSAAKASGRPLPKPPPVRNSRPFRNRLECERGRGGHVY